MHPATATTSILTHPWVPTPSDDQDTPTLVQQHQVEHDISSLLSTVSPFTPVKLNRSSHLTFLTGMLSHPLPPNFVALDASRPWLLYWSLHSLSLLSVTLDVLTHKRVVATLVSCQNPSGGFGGGPGQISHLAPSYAAVCALACVGTEDAWKAVDREGMRRFLETCKRSDGSFVMHAGGEVDVRGTYCALTIATLLNILTPTLIHNVASFIVSCQTYEGGLSSSSFPGDVRGPLGEAHGGYAFCAAASWAMLLPFVASPLAIPSPPSPPPPRRTLNEMLDIPALLRWSVSLQAFPIEGGGFRGRTNKLVDGCYSWWNGGLFGVIAATVVAASLTEELDEDEEDELEDVYDRSALQEYVLLVAQSSHGGLRDKPGKHPDAYHTCYNLSGLSVAQSPMRRDVAATRDEWQDARVFEEGVESLSLDEDEDEDALGAGWRKEVWANARGWRRGRKVVVGDEENELEPTHPIFNITMEKAGKMLDYFYGQQ